MPANTIHQPAGALMLGQYRRLWASIELMCLLRCHTSCAWRDHITEVRNPLGYALTQ